jgi:hypothetical protein
MSDTTFKPIDLSDPSLIRNHAIYDVVSGLRIYDKYGPNLSAEHDVLSVYLSKDLSEEDRETVECHGWFWNDEWECWSRYV